MPDICINAGAKLYTASSLSSTAITELGDTGLKGRSIMFMSDRKCVESLKSYYRRTSNKKNSEPSFLTLPPVLQTQLLRCQLKRTNSSTNNSTKKLSFWYWTVIDSENAFFLSVVDIPQEVICLYLHSYKVFMTVIGEF